MATGNPHNSRSLVITAPLTHRAFAKKDYETAVAWYTKGIQAGGGGDDREGGEGEKGEKSRKGGVGRLNKVDGEGGEGRVGSGAITGLLLSNRAAARFSNKQ
jgi:hypothetical protein